MKKIISMVLVVVMIFSITGICAAAGSSTSYTATTGVVIEKTYTFNPDNFNVSLSVNPNKIGAFDGESLDFTYTIDSVRVGGVEYDEANPEEFFAIFSAEDFEGVTITIDLTVEFVSEAVFGDLEYTVVISGFSTPLDTGDLGSILGDSADLSANLPTDLEKTGTIEGFPKPDLSTLTVLGRPSKVEYFDTEKFDATGTVFSFALDNGKSGILTYNADTAHMFKFAPSASEQLSVYDTEVATIFNGAAVNYTPIVVKHKYSDSYVNITTGKYTSGNPGYHAIVCEGCGDTYDAQPHNAGGWIYNNDQTFMTNGTESSVCNDCGTVLIRDALGTADFNTAFADMHFIKVIFEYINVLLRFIGAATY